MGCKKGLRIAQLTVVLLQCYTVQYIYPEEELFHLVHPVEGEDRLLGVVRGGDD